MKLKLNSFCTSQSHPSDQLQSFCPCPNNTPVLSRVPSNLISSHSLPPPIWSPPSHPSHLPPPNPPNPLPPPPHILPPTQPLHRKPLPRQLLIARNPMHKAMARPTNPRHIVQLPLLMPASLQRLRVHLTGDEMVVRQGNPVSVADFARRRTG